MDWRGPPIFALCVKMKLLGWLCGHIGCRSRPITLVYYYLKSTQISNRACTLLFIDAKYLLKCRFYLSFQMHFCREEKFTRYSSRPIIILHTLSLTKYHKHRMPQTLEVNNWGFKKLTANEEIKLFN